MMDTKYVSVRFMDYNSQRWDGNVSDVPLKTIMETEPCSEEEG